MSVSDVASAKTFSELLLGVAPVKERPRCAKFEPSDPAVNLTLNEVEGAATIEGGSAYCGIQVKSVDKVHTAIERFKSAGFETLTEESTTCCYAVQDKVWVHDPDGHKWKVFVVLQVDAKDQLYEQSGCCGPETVSIGSCQSEELSRKQDTQ